MINIDNIDWNSEDLASVSGRKTLAEQLGCSEDYVTAMWIVNMSTEENIEDSGVVERSEWTGSTQHSISSPADIQEDIEVNVTEKAGTGDSSAQAILQKLRDSQISIPGLPSLDDIVENYISKVKPYQRMIQPYKNLIDNARSEEERQRYINDMNEQMRQLKSSIKEQFQERLDNIKADYKTIKESVTDLPTTISTFATNLALPKVIVTGTAAGVPNVSTIISELMTFKTQMFNIINQLTSAATRILNNAVAMCIELPAGVLDSINAIVSIRALISKLTQPSE